MTIQLSRLIPWLAIMASARIAHADPPSCRADSTVVRLALPFATTNANVRVAVVSEADGAMSVALRVVPRRARGAATRVYVGTIDATGTWTNPPREVTSFPARIDGPIAIASSNGARRVLVAGARVLRSIELPASGEPVITRIVSATRFADRVAVFASLGDRFRLAWNTPRGIEVQDLPVEGPSRDAARPARVPERTRVVSLSGGEHDTTGLVMQTSARRYVVATFDRDGRFHWSGNAPAGCSQHFCAGVQLRPSPDGFLATWVNRRDRDGLATAGAWSLDANGHGRGGRHEFIPMVRGIAIAGPRGEPLAIQFARPIVLRGANRPIAIAQPPNGSTALPCAVEAFVRNETLRIVAVWDDGNLTVSRVTCE